MGNKARDFLTCAMGKLFGAPGEGSEDQTQITGVCVDNYSVGMATAEQKYPLVRGKYIPTYSVPAM